MQTKSFMWDIDGVLIWYHPDDPAKDWRKPLVEDNLLPLWESFQRSPHWARCIRDGGIDTRKRFQKYLENTAPDKLDKAGEIIRTWLENNAEPCRPAIEKLHQLRSQGHECAITSNQDGLRKPYVEDWLRRHDLDGIPRFVSCTLKTAKPDADFYTHVQQALGKKPHDLVLLDDKPVNIDSARESGWSGILIDDSYRRMPENWENLVLI